MYQGKMRIYLRNEGTSLEITGDEDILTLESRAIFNRVPHNIDNWGCKYRKMDDGRCFIVMRSFVPTSFIYDLFMNDKNSPAKDELLSFIADEFRRVKEERACNRHFKLIT